MPPEASYEIGISPIQFQMGGEIGFTALIEAGPYRLLPMTKEGDTLELTKNIQLMPDKVYALGQMLQAVRTDNPNLRRPKVRLAVDEFRNDYKMQGWAARLILSPDDAKRRIILLVTTADDIKMGPALYKTSKLAMVHGGELMDILAGGRFDWPKAKITERTIM